MFRSINGVVREGVVKGVGSVVSAVVGSLTTRTLDKIGVIFPGN